MKTINLTLKDPDAEGVEQLLKGLRELPADALERKYENACAGVLLSVIDEDPESGLAYMLLRAVIASVRTDARGGEES